MARRALLVLAALVLLAPAASAEYGPESHDGYPVSVDGEVVRPPVPPILLVAQDAAIARAYGLLDDEGPLNKVGPFTFYPYYPLLTAEVQRLAQEHPDLVRLTSAGKSTAGLDLWLLEIADFARIESGEGIPLEDREVVYLDGGTHSNEYSGVYFVTEIAQFLLDEYATNETAKWIVENRHVWILPMINPDGSNAFGRLNAKGVNINRNFPGTWGAVDENPVLNNPGPAPASEPETQTVIRLLDELKPDYVNSIHCCGNLWLHPWGAEQIPEAADIQMFTRICDEVFADVRDDCGPIWSTIYPASGTTADEGYARLGASSWTYEMSGRGRIAGPWAEPVTRDDVRIQERESWAGVLHALLHVEKYGARPEVRAVEGTTTSLTLTVENVGYGPLRHGNVTLGGATVALPAIESGATATVTLPGSFAPGEAILVVDWEKRIYHGPQGLQEIPLLLEEQGGRLVGVLGDGVTPAAAGGNEVRVPAPAPALALAVLALLAVALRRR